MEDEVLIGRLEKLQVSGETGNSNWWDELSDTQRIGLLQGMKSFENGTTYTHSEVRQSIRDKFGV